MTRWLLVLLSVAVLVLVGRVHSQRDDGSSTQRFEYAGSYRFTTEVEEGGETCVRWQPEWPMVGAFYVENEESSVMQIREEALGCRLSLLTEGQRSLATDVDCEWTGPVNAQALGMTKRTYSLFEVDFEQRTVSAEGSFERTLKNGTVMVTCFEFSGEVQSSYGLDG